MQYCKEINPDSSSALVTIYIKECMVPCRFLPSIKPTRTGAPMHRTYYSRKRKNEASKFLQPYGNINIIVMYFSLFSTLYGDSGIKRQVPEG